MSTTRWSSPGLIIAAGCLICLMAMGVRSTMGLFLEPMTLFHGWTRADFAFAMAVQNLLWGVFQPFAGAEADRHGSARVIAVGLIVYALGMALMAWSPTPFWLVLTGGLVIGLAQALTAFALVFAAFARLLPEDKRSWAFGMATAAASLGQFLIVPLGQGFIAAFGWYEALWLLALCLAILLPLTLLLRAAPGDTVSVVTSPVPLRHVLKQALEHRSYVLLVSGFFVCGFHVAFIAVHLPAYLTGLGFSPALGALAIALIGLFNVIGAYTAGVLGATHSKKTMLSAIYLARAVVIAVFIAAPPSWASVLIFSALMGLLWLSTVPLTSGLVAVMFGVRNMGMLFGVVFLSHQVGAFLGVWLGGTLFDAYGSYDAVWWISIALGVFAAIIHWPIREQAVPAAAVSKPA